MKTEFAKFTAKVNVAVTQLFLTIVHCRVIIRSSRGHKLKQCTNLILHDGNYASCAVFVTRPQNRGNGGDAYSRGGGGALVLNFGR